MIKKSINESFKKNVNKELISTSIPRYFVRVKTESVQLEDLGLWKIKIVDQYEENFSFTFRIQAEGRMGKNSP